MIPIQDHRSKHNIDFPQECDGFKIDDYVEYCKDGETIKGYIYCFRRFGLNWFAWIYFNQNTLEPEDCIYMGNLKIIEE